MHIGYIDAAFQPSSPTRHATEFVSILSSSADGQRSVLFLHSNNGPEHRLTYVLVLLSFIALFLACNLDFSLCCLNCTSTFMAQPSGTSYVHPQSWVTVCWINAGKMEANYEAEATKSNGLATLQNTAER